MCLVSGLSVSLQGRIYHCKFAPTGQSRCLQQACPWLADRAGLLQATLRTLLAAGAPKAAPHWLALCTQVALAVKPQPGLPAGQAPARGNTDDLPDLGASCSLVATRPSAEHPHLHAVSLLVVLPSRTGSQLHLTCMTGWRGADDSDEEAASGPPPAVAEAEAAKAQAFQLPANPRLRTRLFAAACLLELPGMVGDDPRHFDAVAAQQVATAVVSGRVQVPVACQGVCSW